MKQMRTAFFCVITQQVVEFLTDVSGQPIGPICKLQQIQRSDQSTTEVKLQSLVF